MDDRCGRAGSWRALRELVVQLIGARQGPAVRRIQLFLGYRLCRMADEYRVDQMGRRVERVRRCLGCRHSCQLGEVDRKEVVHDGQRLLWGDLRVGIGG
jgi:hypothetical protein